jgi:RNA polymerase sigma factor (sigma-70 family)
MDGTLAALRMTPDDDERITATVKAESARLRRFVRRQVADLGEVEDIVQETFSELVSAYRLMQPVEKVAAWLLRVARNRIVDGYRAKAREARILDSTAPPGEDGESLLEEWFAADDGGPESDYLREALGRELELAIAELPAEQRAVFVAHEFEGRSFKEIAADTGVGVNTLLGRKHAAVRQLRRRLQTIHAELND